MKQIANDPIAQELDRNKWKIAGKAIKKDWQLYTLLIPLFVSLLLFSYLPMGGVIRAFQKTSTNANGNFQEWVGLTYFKSLMVGENAYEFWRSLKNTFVLSMYGLIFGFPIPIILAIFFSEIKNRYFRSITQIISYLPKFMSTVVITTMVTYMLKNQSQYGEAGIIAMLLEKMNLVDSITGTKLLDRPEAFRAIYHISGIWASAGYGSIVYFAAIMGISPTNYEAAKIDGASKIDQIKNITIPGIMPTLTIMLILKIGDILSVGYEKVLLLYSEKTYDRADVLSTWVYRQRNSYPGIGIAADFFNSLVGMFLVLGANFISRKVSDTSLF